MLRRLPPHAYFAVSAVFHYLGPAFAVLLFVRVGPLGTAWLRIAAAAAVLLAWRRPWTLLLDRTLLQLGVVLALHAPLARLMQRPRWWRLVVAVNALAMSIYLWHMAAVLMLVVLAEPAVGPLATRPDAAWWWSRPVWLAAVLVVQLGLLAGVRRWEVPR